MAHLDLIEGVVVDLLLTKWKSFIKRTFFRQIFTFFIYFLISTYCFVKRPNGLGEHCVAMANQTNTTSLMDPLFVTMAMGNNGTFLPDETVTEASLFGDEQAEISGVTIPDLLMYNSTFTWAANTTGDGGQELDEEEEDDDDEGLECEEGFEVQERDLCFLNTYDTTDKKIRGACEMTLIIWSIIYIGIAVHERTFLGHKLFWENLKLCPSRCGFLMGCFCILFAIPFRLTCQPDIEDNLAITAMTFISFYFLFFCRYVELSYITVSYTIKPF